MELNRRSFIKTSALASTALAIMPSCLSASESSRKIGVQLYTVRQEMENDPMGTLKLIADIGYKSIEAAGYADGKTYGFSGKELKSILNDLGLEFTSGHIRQNVFENSFDQAIEFMTEAGQEYAVFPWLAPDQRTSIDQFKGYAETLNRCAEKAQKAGITVCYHNHDFEFQTLEGQLPIDVLMNETDADLVKMELDLYWITKAGFDPIAFFQEHQGRVPLWHVKDMANTPERGFAEVGTGTIDFKKIFEAKNASGMKCFFVEQDVSEHPMQSIQTSYTNLTEQILIG